MATGRKIDLAGLLNSGELTISTEVSEHATSLGVAKMFDGDITSTQGFRLENSGVDSGDTTGETPPETFTLNFRTPILGKRFAFTLRTNETTNPFPNLLTDLPAPCLGTRRRTSYNRHQRRTSRTIHRNSPEPSSSRTDAR